MEILRNPDRERRGKRVMELITESCTTEMALNATKTSASE